jgi:heat shock protein HslJ
MTRRLVALALGLVLAAAACGEGSEGGAGETAPTSSGSSEPSPGISLAGTRWLVTGLEVGGAVVEVPDGAGLYLDFDANGTAVTGSGGCNSFGGTVEMLNERLRIVDLASTLMGCAPDIADREARFFEALGRVEIIVLEEGRLTLASSDGSDTIVMSARPSVTDAALVGTEWHLGGIISGGATSSVLAGTDPTLVIDQSSGTANGNGGCNSFGATVVIGPESITITDLFSTKMACGKGGVMSQESVVLEVLGRAVSWRVDGDQLLITADDGRALEYRAG